MEFNLIKIAKLAFITIGMIVAGVATAETFRGNLFIGPENEAFYPCGNSSGYWFLASDKIRNRLQFEGAKKSTALSEQGIFVVVVGKVGRKTTASDGEYASTYPAFFRIQKIISINEVSENDCSK